MKTKNVYPDWVEKYRKPGITIRKVKSGYGLYHCTSVYDKTLGYPKSVQEYLGMVTEQNGFIPKRSLHKAPVYVEYGLSHFVVTNFKRDLIRSSYQAFEDLLILGVIQYLFDSCAPVFIRSSFISFGKEEHLIHYQQNIRPNRIKSISIKIDKMMRQHIPDETERNVLIKLLSLCVIDKNNPTVFPEIPKAVKEICERNGLKYA